MSIPDSHPNPVTSITRFEMKSLLASLLIVVASNVGCSSSTEPNRPIRVSVVNELDMELTLRAGTTVLGTIGGFDSVSVTLPAGVRSLEWQSQKRRYSDGSPVPDDLTGATINVSASTDLVTITNLVNGVTYFTPETYIVFSDTASFEVARGGSTLCIGWAVGPSFLFGPRWGYYRLTEGTELRYYRGSRCRAGAAPYRFWSFSLLSTAAIGSGIVSLTADVLP